MALQLIMKCFVVAFICLFVVFQAQSASPQRMPALEELSPDERFLLAHKAIHTGDHTGFERIARSLGGHDLFAYIDYWRIKINFGTTGQDAARQFIERHKGDFLAEKMRSDWLKFLGSRHRWQEFSADFPSLLQPDQELLCYAIQAGKRQRGKAAALDEAAPLCLPSVA